jgi:hypothetical protein
MQEAGLGGAHEQSLLGGQEAAAPGTIDCRDLDPPFPNPAPYRAPVH